MSNRTFIGAPKSAVPPVGYLLSALTSHVHAENQHWWTDLQTGAKLNRNKAELLMLIVSEVAEAMEGARKDLMDTHLPHLKMEQVELADVLIRVFDFAGGFGYNLDRGVSLMLGCERHEHVTLNQLAKACFEDQGAQANKGAALFDIVKWIVAVAEHRDNTSGDAEIAMGGALYDLFAYAGMYGYDLDVAVAEKRAYNAQRADHKRAARLEANGKKW